LTIQRTTQFNDPLPISQFIAPIDEEIVEDESITLEVIVNRYAQGGSRDTQSDIEEEEEREEEKVKLVEAIAALELLILYEKQQEDGQSEVIRKLDTLKATFNQRKAGKAKQAYLELSGGSLQVVRR
jgi:hypothetical protein